MSLVDHRSYKDGLAVGSWHNLSIGIWHDQPTIAAIEEHGRQYRALADRHPQGIAVLIVVEDGVPLPDEAARRAISQIMRDIEPRLLAICGVQEATGFRGAAVRSVITALSAIQRARYKTMTVADVRTGAERIAPFVRPATTPGRVAAAVEAFRTTFESHRNPFIHSV